MKRKRFLALQIVAVLKQAELGLSAADLIRQVGILEQTFYRWKKQYAGLESDQVREFKQISDENTRLEIRQRMHEIAATRIRFGYRRVHIMLRREGWTQGKNLVWRLYREEGLALRAKRPRRRKMVVHREARCVPKHPNDAWSVDFIHDQLSNGQKFRALTAVDVFSREGLAIEVGQGLRGENFVQILNRLVRQRGAPSSLFADNGAEFTGHLVDLCAYHHGTRIDVSRPGRPTDNAFIETFNGSLRDECLNLHWLKTMAEAKAIIKARRQDYNESRPHMAPGHQTPQEYPSRTSPSGSAKDLKAGKG